jgi:uncharacterized protein (TIGR03000 family)
VKEKSVHRILLGFTVGLLVLAVPSAVHAQRGGSGRGGSGGRSTPGMSGGRAAPSFSVGRGGSAYVRPGSVGPNYSRSYYSNPGYYARPVYSSRYYGGVGIYLGDPYRYGSSYGYGYGYPNIYSPAVGPSDFAPSYPRPSDPPPPPDGPSVLEPARLGNIANIRVILPSADAKLLVDGTPTTSTGATRVLETPELKPGASYHYDLTATWEEGARTITEKRRIEVAPGAVTTVDFTRPAPRPQP